MTNIHLPDDYDPFPTLIVCSNELVNVRIPILFGDKPILLIGRGKAMSAQIWLQYPIGSPKGATWEWVVEGNETRTSDAKLLVSEPSFGVYLGDEMLLHLTVAKVGERADVISMDLRPLGMAIQGNMQGLVVAGSKMIGNYFRNAESMLKIG